MPKVKPVVPPLPPPPDPLIMYTHRSGAETYQHCHRQRYLEYHHLGKGIRKAPQPLHLDVGTAVHVGLKGLLQTGNDDVMVMSALDSYDESVQPIVRPEETATQHWLIECLLRAFYIAYWPSFSSTYEILYVEQEISRTLSESEDAVVVFQSRPDAIVRAKDTDELATISWKTIDDLTDYRRKQFAVDLQGFTEMYFSNELLAEFSGEDIEAAIAQINLLKGIPFATKKRLIDELKSQISSTPKTIDYVQTVFFEKGKREWLGENDEFEPIDEATGQGKSMYLQNSFLVNPWFNRSTGKYAHAYRFKKPGNKTLSALGKDWERVNLASQGVLTPSEWVQMLFNRSTFPANENPNEPMPLSKVITFEEPVYRNQQMMDRVIRQVGFQEMEIARALVEVESRGSEETKRDGIDQYFPQHLSSCCVPYHCEFTGICHGGPVDQVFSLSEIPMGFEERKPHHTEGMEGEEG